MNICPRVLMMNQTKIANKALQGRPACQAHPVMEGLEVQGKGQGLEPSDSFPQGTGAPAQATWSLVSPTTCKLL